MKSFVPLLLLFVLLGCKKSKPAVEGTGEQATTITNSTPVITPSTEKSGKVAMVNEAARFVVLSFPIGEVATNGQKLEVLRNESKIGEVKVTGPQRENNTVADILSGEPKVGDEVKGN